MRIRFAANARANLESIQTFPGGSDSTVACDMLLAELEDRVLPNLARFPGMGRLFMARRLDSVEARMLHEAMLGRLSPGDQLREYVMDDHLLLYRAGVSGIDVLAMRHHRQLAFDIHDFLSAPD